MRIFSSTKNNKKISITHINDVFSEGLLIDFKVVYLKGDKFEALNMGDTGTRYGERVIAPSKNARVITDLIEKSWIYHHEALKYFSSNSEFCSQCLNVS